MAQERAYRVTIGEIRSQTLDTSGLAGKGEGIRGANAKNINQKIHVLPKTNTCIPRRSHRIQRFSVSRLKSLACHWDLENYEDYEGT